MKKGLTFTEIKNKVIGSIISNPDIIKALVINDSNFLESTPTIEQSELLNNPDRLIRSQIFPYRLATVNLDTSKTLLTMSFVDFQKNGNSYQNGFIYFYIICPNDLEKCDYGSRYDYICDRLEETFNEHGIGKFEYYRRSDMPIDADFMGSYVAFRILDFYGW